METTVLLCEILASIAIWVFLFIMFGMIPCVIGTKHSRVYAREVLTKSMNLETIPIVSLVWTLGFKIGESVFTLKYGKARSVIGTIKSNMNGISELQ